MCFRKKTFIVSFTSHVHVSHSFKIDNRDISIVKDVIDNMCSGTWYTGNGKPDVFVHPNNKYIIKLKEDKGYTIDIEDLKMHISFFLEELYKREHFFKFRKTLVRLVT